ncbi:hypothetical protein [Terrabacter sp. Soil810]|uniref:hypothetical protein n=1 Tax=Terrabacter sp. Soil810 TaxID=1736418 RepID=UPI00070AEDD7|nr:hypothetical protein [Terrabacter sp. Soil810]KRF46760.1 hypothetical protein ASG96_01630 [Terrabacter sp. Soil810]
MSATQSCLSDPRFGYDFVVATTQESINASMKEFLSGLTEPVVTMCYVADATGKPQAIAHADLVAEAQGSDPFIVPPDADPATNQDLKNLLAARFMMGFRAQLGIPPAEPKADVPNVVTLGADTGSVAFNLLCSEFDVVQLMPGGGYSAQPTWMNVSQPSDAPWVFTSKVDLLMTEVSQSEFSGLPAAVRSQVMALGGDPFSVQQLLFDLDNAALETTPVISGVEPGTDLYTVLNETFLGSYFAQLKAQGQPLLGCVITQPSAPPATLVPTGLELEVCPLLNDDSSPIPSPTPQQAGLATLNYLCSAGGDTLPPAVAFSWNWIDPLPEQQADGVMAINRGAFARYLEAQLYSYTSSNCYQPVVEVDDYKVAGVSWTTGLTPDQAPTVTYPNDESTLISFTWTADAHDESGNTFGEEWMTSSFSLAVTYAGNIMTVTQHLVIYLKIRSLATYGSGNVVDITVVDTYTLAATQAGALAVTMTSTRTDNSKNPSTNSFLNFWTDLNSIIDSIKDWARNVVPTALTDVPVSVLQDFVFPGGKTFTFTQVAFSKAGDLTSEISYTATD